MKYVIFSALIFFGMKAVSQSKPAQEEQKQKYFHYKGDKEYLDTIDGDGCFIRFGETLQLKDSKGTDSSIKVFESPFIWGRNHCNKGKGFSLPKEHVGEGILTVGGFAIIELEYYGFSDEGETGRTRIVYTGEEARVNMRSTQDTSNPQEDICTLPPGTKLRITSFSKDLQFILGEILDNRMRILRPSFCQEGDEVYISPELLAVIRYPQDDTYDSILINYESLEACPAIEILENILTCEEEKNSKEKTLSEEECNQMYQKDIPTNNPIIETLLSQTKLCLSNLQCQKQKVMATKREFCSEP